MEQLTPNSLSSSSCPSIDQWSAPDRSVVFVLAHVRSTARGAASVTGGIHLN